MRDKVRRTRVATCSVRAPMSPSRRHDRSDISWNNAAAFSNLPPTRTTIVCPLWGVPTSNCLCLHCVPVPGEGKGCTGNYYRVVRFSTFCLFGLFSIWTCWKNSVLKGNLIRVKCILFIGEGKVFELWIKFVRKLWIVIIIAFQLRWKNLIWDRIILTNFWNFLFV